MVDFKVRCYHKDSQDNVIGAEVIIYDGDDVVDDILLVDKTKFDELSGKLDTLDDTYIDKGELEEYLQNSAENNIINATLLNGLASDEFLKKGDINSYHFSPGPHASSSPTYGAGTIDEYGHVKLVDDLNRENYRGGEALSSHQGYVLDQRLDSLEENTVKGSLRVLIGRYEDHDGEYGTRIIAQKGRNGIYARIFCDAAGFDASKVILYIDINGVSYEFSTDKTEANRKLSNATDIPGTVISGRLGIGSDFPVGEHILTAFCRYKGDTIFPTTTVKRIVVEGGE